MIFKMIVFKTFAYWVLGTIFFINGCLQNTLYEFVNNNTINYEFMEFAINFFELVDRLRTDCYTMFNF